MVQALEHYKRHLYLALPYGCYGQLENIFNELHNLLVLRRQTSGFNSSTLSDLLTQIDGTGYFNNAPLGITLFRELYRYSTLVQNS